MPVSRHLSRARDLVARPGVWIQGAYARDTVGEVVDSQSPDAVCFCISGAIYATTNPTYGSLSARLALRDVVRIDLEVWNDAVGRTLSDVAEAFDQAIALVGAKRHEPAG